MGSSPESLGLRGLLFPGSPWDTNTLLLLPRKGECQEQAWLPSPAKPFVPWPTSSLKKRLKDSFFSPITSALSSLLCFLELQPIAFRGGGRGGAWGHKLFYNTKLCSLSPLTPYFLGSFLSCECWETGQLRQDGDWDKVLMG